MNDQQTITDEQIRLAARIMHIERSNRTEADAKAERYRRALLDILHTSIIYKDHGDQREAALEIARKALAE